MNRSSPSITVLMSVYNGEKYLREAIDSILNQTFTDFELLIMDNCSTDSSANIVHSYHDQQISLVKNEKNLGIERSLNRGLHRAKGEYIARMDSDDISLPTRLETQIEFMDDHPNIALCGTQAETFGAKHFSIRNPISHNEIRAHGVFYCPVLHPTVMLRKSVLLENNLFYDVSGDYTKAEDYELWTRLSEKHQLYNINEVLLKYRIHENQTWHRFRTRQIEATDRLQKKQLTRMGVGFSNEEFSLHAKIGNENFDPSPLFLKASRNWLMRISKENQKQQYIESHALDKELALHYWKICNALTGLGLTTYRYSGSVPLRKYYPVDWYKRLKFFIRCAVHQQNHPDSSI
jgi:glycosyltransferase involved in cell wall biosynthesis